MMMDRVKKQQRDWAEIPTDALSIIFEKLGFAEVLLSSQAVCRSWRRLALDSTTLVWRCIDMRSLPKDIFKHDQPPLTGLAIHRSDGHVEKLYAVDVNSKFLTYITGRIPKLKCLGLIWTKLTTEEIVNLLAGCPLLEELYICSCPFEREMIVQIGRVRRELKRLRLEGKYHFSDTDTDSELEYNDFMNTKISEDDMGEEEWGRENWHEEEWEAQDWGEEDTAGIDWVTDFAGGEVLSAESGNEDSGHEDSDEDDSRKDQWGSDSNSELSDDDSTVFNYYDRWHSSYCDRIVLEIANNLIQLRELRIRRFGMTNKGLVFKYASLGSTVRLLHCDMEVTGSNMETTFPQIWGRGQALCSRPWISMRSSKNRYHGFLSSLCDVTYCILKNKEAIPSTISVVADLSVIWTSRRGQTDPSIDQGSL